MAILHKMSSMFLVYISTFYIHKSMVECAAISESRYLL